jgi:diaminopimelate epimerase
VASVSLGNPHCVVIVPDLAKIDVHALGPKIERHPAFPKRTNVQFAEVVSPSEVRILIWERGAGYTLASGSSSCAVVAACQRKGLTGRDVTVSMPGGQLAVTIADDGEIRMRGPVEEICTGDLSVDLLRRLGAG